MLKGLEKAKALKELKELRLEKASLTGLALAKSIKRMRELRQDLGMGGTAKAVSSKLTDDDVLALSEKPIDVQENSTKGERKRTAKDWIKQNLLGKKVKTIDGKMVHFNSDDTVDHISFNAMRSRNAFIALSIPFIPQIFAKGEFVGREISDHTRTDETIKAFHLYQKWIKLKNGYEVYAQVQACERHDGKKDQLFYAGYNLKSLEKKKAIFDSLLETGLHHADQATKTALKAASSSHQNGNSDSTKRLTLGFMTTLKNNSPRPMTVAILDNTRTNGNMSCSDYNYMLDKLQSQSLKDKPLLILVIKDETGKVIFDLENGIDELDENPQTTPTLNRPLPPTTKATRQKANNNAIALLDDIMAKGLSRDDLTTDELDTLAKFTGGGGGLTNKDGTKGSDYEYYTPIELASSTWDIAHALGFNGGKVLDPSAGTGIFTAVSPENALMDSIELDETSGNIAKILNDGNRSHTKISPFEAVAKDMPNGDDTQGYDLVITNVPFGDNGARGANKLKDDVYQKESLDYYFIMRSLEKLKSNGLAVFITTPSTVTGKKKAQFDLRQKTSRIAHFLGAYRLPNSMFEQTGADVSVDGIAFRKYDEKTIHTINNYVENGDLTTLETAGVFWQDYISGGYFKTRKNQILGEEVEVPDWRDKSKTVTKVVNHASMTDVLKQLNKFSRASNEIDWQLLQLNEPTAISYQTGDIVYRDGVQYQYDGVVWQEVISQKSDDTLAQEQAFNDLIAKLSTPYDVVVHGVSFAEMTDLIAWLDKTSQNGVLSNRITDLYKTAKQQNNSTVAWQVLCTGQGIDMLIAKHGAGFAFLAEYADFSQKMKDVFVMAKGAKLTRLAKTAHNNLTIHYNKGEYSSLWRGDVQVAVDELASTASYSSQIARLQYANKSRYLRIEQLKQLNSDVDVMSNDDWFITADGKQAIQKDDFLIGSLAERLADIDKQIAQTADDNIKAKLQKQKQIAERNVPTIDVRRLRYDLQSPIISTDVKLEFLKTVSHFAKGVQNKNGQYKPTIEIINKKTDEDKLYNRIGIWLKEGKSLSLGGIKLSQDMTEKQAIAWLNMTANSWNEQFNNWVKVNDSLLDELDRTMNDPKNRYFVQNDDDAPIDIAGLSKRLKLHPHQNVFVRNQGRFFGGINGMGVGLGKTFSSLASVQHAHNVGLKKRTLFVVPKSVLSNWRKETMFAYENMDDCLFIGLRENGEKFSVKSNLFDTDLLEAINGKYRKIFMSYEAFKRIRIKDETANDYIDHLGLTDNAFSMSESKKSNERAKGRGAELVNEIADKGNNNAPFIEDMGIDSIVIDEAHAFKNSITADVGRIKFLSAPNVSKRGLDAQIKMWYIRGLSDNGDGVQLLTATPITNSPVEIYSMLALAVGRERANAMAGGVKGADEFVQMVCNIQQEEVQSIDNRLLNMDVFVGLRNINLLRSAIHSTAMIKNAEDVKGLSVVIPEREELPTSVKLPQNVLDEIKKMQSAYQVAKVILKGYPTYGMDTTAFEKMQARYGETTELLAHPFNLIRKMEVLIADDDFADGVSFYDFDKAQLKQVQKCVAEFNKKGYKDERERLSAYTKEENAKAITQKDDGVSYITGYKVTVQADIVGNRIMIDSMDYKTQKAFEEICERQGVNLDVTIPAKLASLLDNIKFEMANKRGKNSDGTTSSLVKQIIFCDHLFLHNKIVRLLAKHTGIAKDKIAIITGQVNSEADEIIDIQNGFNEMGEDNRYQIIIANKKAEIGINLQKGTQAIHHLTTGWTPDSLEQRNGRGARQGNHTESVRIYYYDADGTFDSLKRNMVNKKDEWIGELLQGNSQSVAVAGDLTDKDKDALINAIGDESAIQTYLKQKEQAETEARIKEATARQIVGLQTIKNNSEMLRCGFIHDVYAKLNTWASVSADLAKTKAIYRDGGEYTGKFVFEIRDDKQQTAYNRFKQATQDILDMLSDNIKNGSDIDSITKAIIDDNLSTIGAKGGWGLGAKNNESGYLFVFSRFALKQGVSLTGQGVVDTNWANLQSDDYIKFTKKQEMGKKLISQAMIAVDDIATNENGKIPVGAGQLVLDNKALLHGDTLYQTGDLVIYHNGENNHVGVVSEYNSLGNRISIYYNSPNGYSHEYIYKNPIEAWHERIDNISQIAKTDSRYLEIVKQLAEFDNKKLRENKETVFSKYNADVLEYVNNN